MKSKLMPRLLISLLGAALILMGLANIILGYVGQTAPGVITHVRRVGGERAEANPNRYTYDISYRFRLPDGREMDGFTKKVGGAVYVKADGTSPAAIKYLPFFPYVNALAGDTGLGKSQITLLVAGAALIWLINQKGDKRAKNM